MSDVVIFGLGDFARVAADLPRRRTATHEVVAFTANERYIEAAELDGLPVVPFERWPRPTRRISYAMFVAIGFSRRQPGARARSTSSARRSATS